MYEGHQLFKQFRFLLKNTSFFSHFSRAVWAIQGGGLFVLTVLSFFPPLFHIEEIIFFLLLGLAFLDGLLEGKQIRIGTRIDFPLFLLLAWILLTTPFSLNPEYSFIEWRKLLAQCLVFYWAVYVIREISQRLPVKCPGPFAKWVDWFRNQNPQQRVFLGVLLGAVLLSGFGLTDFIERGGNWQDRNIRAIAPGSDYNWLSTYLVLAMPIVVYWGLTSRGSWEKILSGGIFVLALLTQAASYSRAGWLSSVVQLSSWGLVVGRRFFFVSFFLAIIFVPIAIMGIEQMGYHSDTLDNWTVKTRIEVWNLGVDKIISHPIVGIGYGNNNFQPVLVDSPMGDTPMHLHNMPLMIAVGSGIPGLVFLLWLFVRLGIELFPKKNQINWTDSDTLKLCLGIVLVGFFCRNLFDYMFAGSLAYLFWILMACGIEPLKNIVPKDKKNAFETG